MSHCHKLVQSWSAQNGIEREADLRNIEEDTLRAEALCHPKCDREGDATVWCNQHWAHSREWRDGWSFPIGIYSFLKVARLMRLRAAPPSIKTWYSLMLEMVGETSSGS
jgi:hypothetical protein